MSNDSDDLRKRMAQIRRELDEDVETVVEQAKELTDWKKIVAKHPFLTVSAAAAVGFLIVPNRLTVMSPDSKTLEKLAKRNRLVVKPKADVRNQAGVVSPIVSLLAGAIMRGGLNMAGQHISKLLAPNDQMPNPNTNPPSHRKGLHDVG